ncbi:MAG: hypothetical protein RLZZ04_1998 [Cyanobacteriota bacterium]|jgi:hypothetical protein
MVRTKPGQKIHVDTLQTALSKLEQLESKPKSELNLRESIFFLKDKLHSALKKGYSYQDLSEILSEQEILISAATLKQYLTDMSKKNSSSRRKRDQSGNQSSSSSNAKLDAQTSTNVTDSQSELAAGNSQSEINSLEKSNSSDSKGSKSIKTAAKTKVKPKVFSGFDDDLSADFND